VDHVLDVKNNQPLRRYLQIQATRALRWLRNVAGSEKDLQKIGVIRGTESVFAFAHILPKELEGV